MISSRAGNFPARPGPSAPRARVALAVWGLLGCTQLHAQAPADLAAQLAGGGYVLVMRHASSPQERPTRRTAAAGNTPLERQLDDTGRATATAMGHAMRGLGIALGDVLTSPTYRARETARYAGFSNAVVAPELGDTGLTMQGATDEQAAWLRARVARPPRAGNVLLVTHQTNLSLAFPDWGASVAQGETIVFKPDGKGGVMMVARVPIGEWPRLKR